jgi:hypothetical protein
VRSIKSRWAFALLGGLALAVPAGASAHPQVYSLTPNKAPTGCTYEFKNDGSCLEPGTVRYAIANDGYAMTYTETVGSNPSRGIINYQLIPGGFRKWKVGEVEHQMTAQQLLGFAVSYPAQTSVQPHATCGLAVLEEPATIAAWQESEPFFNYVPWQKKSAGLGDDPAHWIPVVKEETGADLAALPNDDPATEKVNEEVEAAKALCEDEGGTYYKADAGSNPAGGAIADAVEREVAPFEAEVEELLGEKGSLEAQIATWSAKGTGLEGEKAALLTENESLKHQFGILQRSNAKKSAQIKSLRKRLRKAGKHG